MGNKKSLLAMDTSDPSAMVSHAIDRQIKQDRIQRRAEIKLLLLGAGESGKSTVLRQMRLIHQSGFKDMERETFRCAIFQNVVQTIQDLLEVMAHQSIAFDNTSLSPMTDLFNNIPRVNQGHPFPAIYLEPLKMFWKDAGIQEALLHCPNVSDNVDYFFNRLDTLWSLGYVPTDQDIIRCRSKTTGINEATFHLGRLTYRMFDVGGQRSERKKWIHAFENVTSVLFVVAMSGYDQCLLEDRDANQMQESLILFDSICNSRWFTNTSMILLLNKIDVFKRKVQASPISQYFPDYKGRDGNYSDAQAYFKKRFQSLNHNPSKRIYVHFTDATDTRLLQNVMMAVSHIILNENLKNLMD